MTSRPLFLGPLFLVTILTIVVCVFWKTFIVLVTPESDSNISPNVIVGMAFFWIVWMQRSKLRSLPIQPCWLGLIGLACTGLVWLIGELVFVRVLTDFAVVVMVSMAVLTVLGYRWLSALRFPLSFLLLAIPFWDPLTPVLVEWTAHFTFQGIRASGIPVYREGAYLVVPTGSWSIADACSGIRYLRTCLLLGILYAWSMYESFSKRIVFAVGAVVIGIVGNWVRAYLTILIAHLSDNRLLREGHGTFGWLFFAALLFVYFWLGWRRRETENREVRVTELDRDRYGPGSGSGGPASVRQVFAVSAVALTTMVAWPLYQMTLTQQQHVRPIEVTDISPQNDWFRVSEASTNWTPELRNPSRQRVQTFEKAGRRVSVFIGTFHAQTWTSKLVTSVNELVSSDNRNWSLAGRGIANTEFSGKPIEVKSGVVIGRGERIVAWNWYWVDGTATASDIRAKINQMLMRFGGRDDTSAWIAIYTANEDVSTNTGRKVLDEFLRDMGGSLERALRLTIQG
ncbi:MAG: EpsI family protein [Gammaproteobacteria bacterium RIFCSPLOWO2_02_FULL_61_13]|nr:MAG: EpsI family protein [Gammaproteobacteria bacterium RIFCSPLOWO2_02_FULL_61_13]